MTPDDCRCLQNSLHGAHNVCAERGWECNVSTRKKKKRKERQKSVVRGSVASQYLFEAANYICLDFPK